MSLLFIIFLNLVATIAVSGSNLKILTPLGQIEGSTLSSRLNKTIYAFRGIRYAQAPVGDLRFKPPVPVEKWSGTYNATVDGPLCPQPSDSPVSEDCLLLNVYTTKLPEGTTNPNRPVIIYIHAGGFYSVGGSSDWAGPQYFMDQDIVLVTINYRLGSLGFISTGADAPGNNGLKDQVVALKWVKNNIEAFGGDANSVTLYGYSAGSLSIMLHLVSPMSRGLFHKAILGSGSVLGQLVLPHNQLDLAKKQATLVGCPDDVPPQTLLNCLKGISAEDLGNSLEGFAEFGGDPILIWYPIVEDDFGQERFLPEHPLELFERGDFAKVPVVIGVTKDEFSGRAFDVVGNATLLQQLSDNFETYGPIAFVYERGTQKSKSVSAALRKFYLGSCPLSNSSLPGLIKLYADSIIGFPVNSAVNVISRTNSAPVYYYEFTYQGRFSHFYLPGSNGTVPFGVVHHDDLIYAFYISPLFPFFDSSYPEREMVETLTSLWATFAKTGCPTPKSTAGSEKINWEPYNTTTQKYLEIGKELVLRERLYEDRYNAWYNLFPVK